MTVTTTAAAKDVVRRYFAALDAQDLDAAEALLAPGYVAHVAGSPEALDRAGMRGFAQMFFAAFPDLGHGPGEPIAEGDRVATPLTARGTHRGAFQGIAPTGRAVAMEAVNITRLAGDRIAEQWIVFDGVGLLRQLGALPGPAADA